MLLLLVCLNLIETVFTMWKLKMNGIVNINKTSWAPSLPSVWAFSWNCIMLYFGMVLETHMKLCVIELDFPVKFFLPPKLGKSAKNRFFWIYWKTWFVTFNTWIPIWDSKNWIFRNLNKENLFTYRRKCCKIKNKNMFWWNLMPNGECEYHASVFSIITHTNLQNMLKGT